MRSKYGAIKTEFNGIKYDSKKEAGYAVLLNTMLKGGVIRDIQRQVVFAWTETHAIDLNAKVDFKRKYVADFTFYDIQKEQHMIVDVKGYRTAEYKKKKKIVEKLFNIVITEK